MSADVLEDLRENAKNFKKAQEERLFRILKDNQDTEYGKKYGFEEIRSVSDYRRRVPLTVYADYEPYIKRMLENGEERLTTAYPIRYYSVSSGTTGEMKKIPITDQWIDVYEHYAYICPEHMVKDYYRQLGPKEADWEWKILLLNEIRRTPFMGGMDRLLASGAVFERRREHGQFDYDRYLSPEDVQFPSYYSDMGYLKLRFALVREDLTVIEGVYIHQVLTVFTCLEQQWEQLVADIASGTIYEGLPLPAEVRARLERLVTPMPERAAQLREIFEAGFDTPVAPRIWKRLRAVIAIAGSIFTPYMEKLRRYIGDTPYHYAIYAATEGFFGTAPGVGRDEYMLAPTAGFFEFIPEEDNLADHAGGAVKTLDVTQIRQGEKYELVYTGVVGFYRYRMGDVVEVTGFCGGAPLVRFCYRGQQCVNMAGEKMNMESIALAVDAFAAKSRIQAQEFCVYPDVTHVPASYMIFVEARGPVPDAARGGADALMDDCLREQNMDYDDCRNLGELAPPKVRFLKKGAFEGYKVALQEKGREIGQYKPVRLLDTEERIRYFFGAVSD